VSTWKPILGSKAASGLYQAIISLMPPHDVYMGF